VAPAGTKKTHVKPLRRVRLCDFTDDYILPHYAQNRTTFSYLIYRNWRVNPSRVPFVGQRQDICRRARATFATSYDDIVGNVLNYACSDFAPKTRLKFAILPIAI
jgi:hypothetical protein